MSQQQQKLPHDFSKRKIVGIPYCAHCGLIYLRNRLTEQAARRACPRD